jgi:hypothetical protein
LLFSLCRKVKTLSITLMLELSYTILGELAFSLSIRNFCAVRFLNDFFKVFAEPEFGVSKPFLKLNPKQAKCRTPIA